VFAQKVCEKIFGGSLLENLLGEKRVVLGVSQLYKSFPGEAGKIGGSGKRGLFSPREITK